MKYPRTFFARTYWCGATSSMVLENGNEINLMCTRHRNHKIAPNTKEPLKHFDEMRRRSWYDEPNPAIDEPSQPR